MHRLSCLCAPVTRPIMAAEEALVAVLKRRGTRSEITGPPRVHQRGTPPGWCANAFLTTLSTKSSALTKDADCDLTDD